jgi:hypothetical protein
MKILPVLLIALVLSGCATGGGMVPMTDEAISSVTTGATTSLGYVTDASAIKELAVHKTLQNRDRMIAKSHQEDGFKMSFTMTEVAPGVMALLPKEISYKEQARFDQKLPVAPSEHPGWRVAEKIGVAAIQGTVVGFGINAASDVLQSAIGSAGHNTTGSHNIADSGNTDSSVTAYDNRVGPVDNSDNSTVDNSVGPVDNSVGPVDNSRTLQEELIDEDN